MSFFYVLAGLNHFVHPSFNWPLIPSYMGHPVLLNNLSGVAEIVLGSLLLYPATRRLAAFGVIAMLLAFIPAHIWMITEGGCFSPASFCMPIWVLWVRLLVLHPWLIAWAYSHTHKRLV